MTYWSIDGVEWTVPCKITRTAEIRPSQISGFLLDKSYFNDVLGTYMQYDIAIAVPLDMRAAYTTIYEKLTESVDGHTFVLPYNQTTLQLTARVTNVRDIYVRMSGGGTYWKGIQFTIIGNNPTKTVTLAQAINRGMTPVPNAMYPENGDQYTYDASLGAWVKTTPYANADEIAY